MQGFNKWVAICNIDVGVMKDLSGLAKAIKPTRLLGAGVILKCHDRYKQSGADRLFVLDTTN